jgi:hypothetical protein
MQVVLYDAPGQELRHALPAAVGSATYEILDLRKDPSDPARVIASGAATVPAWSLTLDGPAGPGQPSAQTVPVASTVGPSLGDLVFVTAASGAFETAEVSGVVAADSLELSSNLSLSYDTGDAVDAAEISAPVPVALYSFEDALKDQRPLAVLWSYDLGGGKVRAALESLKLSITTSASTQAGEALALVRVGYPDMPGRVGPGLTLESLAEYCEDMLRAELVLRAEDPERMMTGRPGVWLLHDLIVSQASLRGYAPATIDLGTFVSQAGAAYGRRLDALVVGTGGGETTTTTVTGTAEQSPDTTYRGPIKGW